MAKESIHYSNKIEDILKKYNLEVDDAQVKAAVTKLIANGTRSRCKICTIVRQSV